MNSNFAKVFASKEKMFLKPFPGTLEAITINHVQADCLNYPMEKLVVP